MKRLYKSKTDRVISGVCGGVGEYFDIDPVLIRIIWVLLAVLGGSGILAYIIGMIIIPDRPESGGESESDTSTDNGAQKRTTSRTFWGILLVAIGLIVLLDEFNIFRYFSAQFWQVTWSVIFPVFLIIIGMIILFRRSEKSGDKPLEHDATKDEPTKGPGDKPLVRIRSERKLAGVCAGLAYYLSIDPTIIRLLWIVGTFATGGIAILIYIILAIVLPESETAVDNAQGDSEFTTSEQG